MVLGYEHTHLCHASTIEPSKRFTRSLSGHTSCPRRADVPNWDLVAYSAETNSRCLMQTSPLISPPQLRSGRVHPAPRSDGEAAPIRILLGDGDTGFRRALRASLATEPGIEVVGEADDGGLALQLIRCLRPDVALLAEDMPSFGGSAIARILRSELPETHIVVLTGPQAGSPR
jgi:response regulator receiver domain-containing protein